MSFSGSQCKQLGERVAVISVRIKPQDNSDALYREARRRLCHSLERAGRSGEIGHFVDENTFQKGQSLIYKFRKAPETRTEA